MTPPVETNLENRDAEVDIGMENTNKRIRNQTNQELQKVIIIAERIE